MAGSPTTGSSASGGEPSIGGAYKEWTLAFYLASETSDNLLGDNYVNSLERHYAELAPFANIIVLLDGTAPTKLLQVRADDTNEFVSEIPPPSGTALAQLFELSDNELLMSTPQVLKAFAGFAQSRYPSKYFALTVLDHGEAWNGAVYDDSNDGEPVRSGPMPLAHFADVFSSLARPIDVLAFDACLMQELTAHSWWFTTGGQVRYAVGSEQTNVGWNINKVLGHLIGVRAAEGMLSPLALATGIVGNTNEGEWARNVTESAVDLGEWQGVVDSLDALGAALLAAGGMNNATVKAVVNERVTRPYGDFDFIRDRMSQVDLVDAIDLCDVLEQAFGAETPITQAAAAFRAAVRKAVVANGARRPGGDSPDSPNAAADVSHGVSLHLPKTDTPAALGATAYNKQLGRLRILFPNWLAFLNTI